MVNLDYDYQSELTPVLDLLEGNFTQDMINTIVLWKVNRFAPISSETLTLINQISKSDKEIDIELTKNILVHLLAKTQRGIRLAMASTILRFKNPKIYQIIDQRVYRFLYGKELKYPENDIDKQIDLYLNYLFSLREICNKHNIPFERADRILYSMDKKHNSSIKLKSYSS